MNQNNKILDTDMLNFLRSGKVREDFPILSRTIHDKPLVYFDNAATTQKPISVIETTNKYYSDINSNIHRGVHLLSQISTDEYEKSRKKVKNFINAKKISEVVFVKGTTEGINLVVSTYGRKFLKEGDEVVITAMEHHSNIVPWQMLREEKGIILKVIPINDSGELILDDIDSIITEKTKFLSCVHISNTLGTINPIKTLIDKAHSVGAVALVDGAQSIQHVKIDVQELDCDFFVLSGHKLYGPTGIGVLYGKEAILEKMPPYQGGGDMIASVTFEKTLYNELPYKFEAGTPDIAGVIGLGSAIDYVQKLGLDNIATYEQELYNYLTEKLDAVEKLKQIGRATNRTSVYSFVLEGIHPHDIGTILDFEGVAVRTGHLCTQPLMKRFNIPAVARASISFYNTKEEVDILAGSIKKVFEVFA